MSPSAPTRLSPAARARVEAFVRPLYVGTDGVEGFDRVAALERRVGELAGDRRLDRRLVELLCLFHGVVRRLGSLGPNGRLDLFLRDLGLADEESRAVRRGLGRLGEGSPRCLEEALIDDALRLSEVGVAATLARLLEAGRRRAEVGEALAELDPGPEPESFTTEPAREAARRRRERALQWIAELEAEIAGEG